MRYKLLGRSGLRVSELCLGTMTFGQDWGWGASREESRAMYDAFRGAGGNFIDTANLYTNGTSETFLGEFTAAERASIVLATKYTNAVPGNDPNAAGNHRKSMMQAVEASLRRLQTDYIDLYWLHIWDFLTPIEEVMRGFDDLVRAGKILYAGISDAPAWVVARANTMAELRGWTSFIGLQIEYSLIQRTPERELLPMARELEIGVTAWAPLASGVLTGKYNDPSDAEPKRIQDATIDERKQRIVDAVQVVAAESGRSPSQIAINWVRQQPGVIPIMGARTLKQAQDNLDALKFKLTSDELKKLDEASRIELGFPHDFFARDLVRGFVYGGTRELIDNDRPPQRHDVIGANIV